MQTRKIYVFITLILVVLLFFYYNLFSKYKTTPINVTEFHPQAYLSLMTKNLKKFELMESGLTPRCSQSIVVLVLCPVRDVKLRESIRRTWGQWIDRRYTVEFRQLGRAPRHNSTRSRDTGGANSSSTDSTTKINYHSDKTRLLFATAPRSLTPRDVSNDLAFLRRERNYDDILFFPDLHDDYMNLTLKTLSGLNAALKVCSNADFFMKVDTDVFLNVPRMLELLEELRPQAEKSPIIVGNKQVRAPVIRQRSSKWFVPVEVYSEPYFPDYVTGCGYILSRTAVDLVVTAAQNSLRTATIRYDSRGNNLSRPPTAEAKTRPHRSLFFWEDVAVTGLYSAGCSIIHSPLIRYEEHMASVDTCTMRSLVLAHRISSEKRASLWNSIVAPHAAVQCTPTASNYYGRFEQLIRRLFSIYN